MPMRIDQFLSEIAEKLPPAPPDQLDGFEADLGVILPADYRNFLISCNGGYVGGRYWFMGPTPEGKAADAGVHHIGGFREESHFSLAWARDCYQGEELRIPRDLIWIMDDPFGNAICLGIRGEHRGRVYFWDHEREPDADEWNGEVQTAGNLQLLADSFTDFVAGLADQSA
jgi:hypothetical protein